MNDGLKRPGKRAQFGYGGDYHRKVSLVCIKCGANQYIVYVQNLDYYDTIVVYTILRVMYSKIFMLIGSAV